MPWLSLKNGNTSFGSVGANSLLTVNGSIQIRTPAAVTANMVLTAVDNTGRAEWRTATGGAPTFPLQAPAATPSAPSYSFSTDVDSGMYSPGVGTVSISSGGLDVAKFSQGTVQMASSVIEAKGFASGQENFSITTALTTGTIGGSSVAYVSLSATSSLNRFAGCANGTYRVGQTLTLVAQSYFSGTLTIVDTAIAGVLNDAIILAGSGNLAFMSSATNNGSTLTLMCVKPGANWYWAEVSRSINTN